jgi:hypothetical protein
MHFRSSRTCGLLFGHHPGRYPHFFRESIWGCVDIVLHAYAVGKLARTACSGRMVEMDTANLDEVRVHFVSYRLNYLR